MLASAIPTRIQKPFADDAGSGKNVIPVTPNPTPGGASFSEGFPPLTRTPIAAGGIPPAGQDMNGILWAMSAWNQWQGAGGPVAYDSTFSTAVGGYPKGAVLAASAGNGLLWLSTADNNTTNPDSGGAGWVSLLGNGVSTVTNTSAIAQPGVVLANASGGNVTLTLPSAALGGGLPIEITISRTDTSANTLTIQRAGSDTLNGLTSGTLPVGASATLVSDGVSAWRLVASAGLHSAQVVTATGNVTVPWWARTVRARGWSGAGGGGGSSGSLAGGQGGYSGAYFEGVYQVTPGASIPCTIGTGGAGGTTAPTAGVQGGSTSFGAFASAEGGSGGAAASPGFPFPSVGAPVPNATGGNVQNYSGTPGVTGSLIAGSQPFAGTGGISYGMGAGWAAIGSGPGTNGQYPGQGGNGGGAVNPGAAGFRGQIDLGWMP